MIKGSQRVTAAVKPKGVAYKHSGSFRGFVGIELLKAKSSGWNPSMTGRTRHERTLAACSG
jgi:hypothetical protein